MGITDKLKGMMGNVEKAILFVGKDDVESGKDKGAFSALDAAKKAAESLKNIQKIGDINAGLVLEALDDDKKIKSADQKGYLEQLKKKYHAFYVQYNPSSLNFTSRAGSIVINKGGGEGGNKISMDTEVPAYTNLNVDMIFQDVNPADAFGKNGFEKIINLKNNLSVSGIYQEIKANKAKYSVQDQVEALLSLLCDLDTAKVIFHWGEMDFEGVITSMNANYIMFSNTGRPIAATVSMSLRNMASSDSNDAKDDNESKKYWDKAFDNIFTDDSLATDKDESILGNVIQF